MVRTLNERLLTHEQRRARLANDTLPELAKAPETVS